MNQRRDMTLPTLVLASLTAYGFLLVWAQNDTIELTTNGNHRMSMGPSFNVVSGGNMSIDLAPWHSTSIMPAVTTLVQDTDMDSTTTAATSLNGGLMPLLTEGTNNNEGSGDTTTTSDSRVSPAMTDASLSTAGTQTPGTSPGTITNGNTNTLPRSMKRSRAVTNSTGRVSIKVKILSSVPKDEALEMFLKKVCEFFQTLALEDADVTLGPDKIPMLCTTNNIPTFSPYDFSRILRH